MRPLPRLNALVLILVPALTSAAALAQDDRVELTGIEIIGTTPLHGIDLPAEQVPANVQTATDEDMERVQGRDLSDFMNKTFGSVSVNQAQNNPFQPDLKFRGFTASDRRRFP